MTNEEIKSALKICEQATPGPWKFDIFDETTYWVEVPETNPKFDNKLFYCHDDFDCQQLCIGFADAKFIALARELLPKALAEISSLKSQLQLYDDSDREFENLVTEKLREAEAALAKANELAKPRDSYINRLEKDMKQICEENLALRAIAEAAEKFTTHIDDRAHEIVLEKALSAWRELGK